METTVLIRYATPQDTAPLTTLSIQTLWEAFGPPHNLSENVAAYVAEALTEERLRQELTDPNSTFLLAIGPDGALIGYAKLRKTRPVRQLRGQSAVEIQRLYVLASQIGTGLGRQLMEQCLAEARAQGYRTVWLGVWERNERAIGFYERMGFRRIGWHYFQFGTERQRDYWMSKEV